MTITPTNQENKGRFNRRTITLGETIRKGVYFGTTDTGKNVWVSVGEYQVFIKYRKSDSVFDTFGGGWGNAYHVENLKELENYK